MRVSIYSLSHFTLSECGDFAMLIPAKPIEIEEGQQLEVVCQDVVVFQGDVCSAWTNCAGIQIVQAVVTSVSSSGHEHYRGGILLSSLRPVMERLDSYDRRYVLEELDREFGQKETE